MAGLGLHSTERFGVNEPYLRIQNATFQTSQYFALQSELICHAVT
jgi:hypothetical protein